MEIKNNLLEKIDIVMFGLNDWRTWEKQGFCSRNAVIVKKLAQHPKIGRIIIVSTASSLWINIFRAFKKENNLRKLKPFSLREVEKNIYLLEHTRLLPKEEEYEVFFQLNAFLHDRLLRSFIKEIARKFGMRNYILWVSNPLMAKHIGSLEERLSVFDAIDDWTCHPQKKFITKSIRRGYEIALKKADLIFTVSSFLAKKLNRKQGNVYWIPNGVDYNRFQGNFQMPKDIANLQRPILGYVGVLQERVDVELLNKLAAYFPQASIVLLGPMFAPRHFRSLKGFSNVHFLGSKHHSEIPKYLQFFDVCLVPHVQNNFTHSMNPLKIYEYLAAGKPVVATSFRDASGFQGVIKVASTREKFIQLVLAELGNNSILHRKKRLEFAHTQSWDSRVKRMLNLIFNCLDGKSRKTNRDVLFAQGGFTFVDTGVKKNA